MFKNVTKVITSLLVVTTILATSVDVEATSYSSNGEASMLIKTRVASKWEVTIPSAVEFSTVDKEASYEVSVSGDVADTSVISVVPDSTVTLTNDSGQNSINLNVAQDTTSWSGTEISSTPVTTSGLITSDSSAQFGAGVWQGELNFVVRCTEAADVTAEVFNLIKTLEFYGAGDSIMEGYGNNYIGVLDTMNKNYAVNVAKDYSVSGSRITNSANNGTISVHQQIGIALARLNADNYTSNTVFVFDGGGNDAIAIAQGEPGITMSNMDSGNTDIAKAFSDIYGAIVAAQDTAGVRAPMVYIIPKLAADEYNDVNLALQQTIKDLAAMVNDDRLILIDCNEILTATGDLADDKIHLTESGYAKVNKVIVESLYDYYN